MTAPFVVAGIDASPCAEQALDWAADEAFTRDVQLRIAHSWLMSDRRLAGGSRPDWAAAAEQGGADLLGTAEQRAREHRPGLDVTTALLSDEPVTCLLNMAEGAELLVVGSRGLNRFSALLLGSVSYALATYAPVPVTVVRFHHDTGTAMPPKPVVLGLGPGEAQEPVEFAFAEAEHRAVPLRAVRAWLYPQVVPGHMVVPPDEAAEQNQLASEDIEHALAPGRKSRPNVPVTTWVGLGEPEAALVEASHDASLLVVGARRHRGRFAMPLGPVARRVLHHAACPVTVVPV